MRRTKKRRGEQLPRFSYPSNYPAITRRLPRNCIGRGCLCVLPVSTHISCLPNLSDLHPQSKFAIGDLTTAKKYTLRAMAAEKDIKFADEKKSAKESKDLMDKINAILGDRQ